MISDKMPDKMKKLLVLLLILLKEAGPTAACGSSCSSRCDCGWRGLTSVPQDLPTNITRLDLQSNSITTLSQSDFSRYGSLTLLQLRFNRISVINSGAFYNLSRLTHLYLYNNRLTILQPDVFVGLDNLQYLYLYNNNIHRIQAGTFNATPQLDNLNLDNNNIYGIEAGIFNATPQLQTLSLQNNQLTSLRSEIFMGLEHLQHLYLDQNNIRSIEAGTFSNTPQLRTLRLYNNSISTIAAGTFANLPLGDIDLADNYISTFPVEALSNLNTSLAWPTLRMNHNQMETLPSAAFDILASFRSVYINNNPWQCDCRMFPFKQRMTGLRDFERQIICAGPAILEGRSLLLEDLNCAEANTAHSTFPGGFSVHSTPPADGPSVDSTHSWVFSLASFLSGLLGVVAGILLASAVFLAIWRSTRKTSPAPNPNPNHDTRVTAWHPDP